MIIAVKNGRIQAIAPDSMGLLEQMGECTVRRASHVEPVPTEHGIQWSADLSPVGGPVLGPYKNRSEALDAEQAWLAPRLGTIEFTGANHE